MDVIDLKNIKFNNIDDENILMNCFNMIIRLKFQELVQSVHIEDMTL